MKIQKFITKRLIALTIILLVFACLAQLEQYFWVFELFSHLSWYYFIGGILLGVLLALFKKFKWAMLAFLIAVLHLPFISGYKGDSAASCSVADTTDSLTIVQFNVSRSNTNQEEIIRWITATNPRPQVIVLIEVTPAWEAAIQGLKKEHYPYVLAQYEYDNYGIAVLSNLTDSSFQLENIGDIGIFSISMSATTGQNNIPFFLLAAHPPPPISKDLSQHRNLQLKKLSERISSADETAKILVGDLNLTPWSYQFKKLLIGAKLRNAQYHRSYMGTWPSLLPDWLAIPIDHTLISSNINVEQRTTGPDFGSDHKAVISKLLLGKKDCNK